MSGGFSPRQLKKLATPLDSARVLTREHNGKTLAYIEGWFAIAEANRIFGFDGWDRELVHFERVFSHSKGPDFACGCVARVRICVRTPSSTVVREGTGFGHANASSFGDACEHAFKTAETDATKRALATFGGRFGLMLYEKSGARSCKQPPGAPLPGTLGVQPSKAHYRLVAEDGKIFEPRSAEGFCTGLRQLLEAASTAEEVRALRGFNQSTIGRLRTLPHLKTARGEHYADVLDKLIVARLELLGLRDASRAERAATKPSAYRSYIPVPSYPLVVLKERLQPERAKNEVNSKSAPETNSASVSLPATPTRRSQISGGFSVDKSALAVPCERRLRSKAHLNFVATRTCLVCEGVPCHAHHITFAQPRGLSQKVSDEFTVPLCTEHHNALHLTGAEASWWRSHGVDPMPEAQRLWLISTGNHVDKASAQIRPHVSGDKG